MKFFIGIFLLVGLGLLAGGIGSFQSTSRFLGNAKSANGIVVENRYESGSGRDSSGSYYSYIKFTAENGKEITFRSSVGTNPASYHQGDKVEVYYDPDQPEKAEVNSFFRLWFLSIMLSGMGVVFSAVPLTMIYFSIRAKKLKEWLKQHGDRIEAEYTGVDINTNLSVNGQNPYIVTAQWVNPRTREVQVFRSENFWYDPTSYMTGKTVKVLVDRNNPNRYFMDLSALPKKAS